MLTEQSDAGFVVFVYISGNTLNAEKLLDRAAESLQR